VGGDVVVTTLYLDTETFSRVNLKKVGAYAYARDPSTRILLVPAP